MRQKEAVMDPGEKTEEAIRQRAYEIWERKGRQGDPLEHWFEAKWELGPSSRADAAASNPEAVPPGAAASGENTCRKCQGKGVLEDGSACPDCLGTGKVTAPIGGA
jgi:hypothetical protein